MVEDTVVSGCTSLSFLPDKQEVSAFSFALAFFKSRFMADTLAFGEAFPLPGGFGTFTLGNVHSPGVPQKISSLLMKTADFLYYPYLFKYANQGNAIFVCFGSFRISAI